MEVKLLGGVSKYVVEVALLGGAFERCVSRIKIILTSRILDCARDHFMYSIKISEITRVVYINYNYYNLELTLLCISIRVNHS